jgi:hypothetical protein
MHVNERVVTNLRRKRGTGVADEIDAPAVRRERPGVVEHARTPAQIAEHEHRRCEEPLCHDDG